MFMALHLSECNSFITGLINMNLYFLKNFNNYFNRKVILHDNLSEYVDETDPEQADNFFKMESVNFKPNDGITTSQVVGNYQNAYTKTWNPDYLLVVDSETNQIESRWFVTEFTRAMGNQYIALLKRDSIADKYNLVISTPTYIEKGHLEDDDIQIVNSEGISVNQIKDGEYFLKDKTRVPWLVAYVPQNRNGTEDEPDVTGVKGYSIDALLEDALGIPNLTDDEEAVKAFLPNGNFRTSAVLRVYDCYQYKIRCGFGWFGILGIPEYKPTFIDSNGGQINYGLEAGLGGRKTCWFAIHDPAGQIIFNNHFLPTLTTIVNDYQTNIANIIGNAKVSGQTDYYNNTSKLRPTIKRGKIVKYNNKYYRMNVDDGVGSIDTSRFYPDEIRDNVFQPAAQAHGGGLANERETPEVFDVPYRNYTYSLIEITLGKRAKGFIRNASSHCLDAPYDIIAMPLGNVNVYNNGVKQFTTNYNIPISFAREMAVKMTNAVVYDIQVLPYCPCEGMIDKDSITGRFINEDGDIELKNYSNQENYGLIKDGDGNPISIYFYATYSHRTDDITELGYSAWDRDAKALVSTLTSEWLSNRKLCNECTMERLASPNYNGLFEFNMSKMVPINKEFLEKFNFDCDFRPYNPYIHINPDFGFLYGKDYNDQRGLICGGNFGITTMSDKWQEYQLNNKNFQSMFDRQIMSLEINRAIAREHESYEASVGSTKFITDMLGGASNLVSSTVKGGAKGGWVGAAVGAAKGASGIIGSVVGNMQNLRGLELNRNLNEAAYQEGRAFKQDMFNMQLGNIQALPQSIANSSALTYNFKWFPVLEHYSCRPEEQEIIKNKLKYNGMTVGRIDRISNFLSDEESRFIKGQIIRIDELGEDSHLASDIYMEINKGLFFYPYTPSDDSIAKTKLKLVELSKTTYVRRHE